MGWKPIRYYATDRKSSVIYLLSMFFDPHDFEVTTNLKRALSFVYDGENILTLVIVFKAEVKKKSASSHPVFCFRRIL